MKKVFIASLVSSIAIFLLLTFMSNSTISYEGINPEVVKGKQIWQRKACVECHTLLGNGGYNAPDLTNALSRRDKNSIKSFLIDRPIIRTAKAKRHIKLAQEEVESILSYLEFVNTVNTNGWPPNPRLKLNR